MEGELQPRGSYVPLIAAGVLLGIGLGGCLEGILFRQIFRLHNMLSALLPTTNLANIEINLLWNGLFLLAAWALTVLGLALLWMAVRRGDVPLSTRVFAGSLLLGWGTFNLFEGILAHFVLGLHHLVERLGLSVFDYLYVVFGVLLIALGSWLIRAGMPEARLERPWRERGPVG